MAAFTKRNQIFVIIIPRIKMHLQPLDIMVLLMMSNKIRTLILADHALISITLEYFLLLFNPSRVKKLYAIINLYVLRAVVNHFFYYKINEILNQRCSNRKKITENSFLLPTFCFQSALEFFNKAVLKIFFTSGKNTELLIPKRNSQFRCEIYLFVNMSKISSSALPSLSLSKSPETISKIPPPRFC